MPSQIPLPVPSWYRRLSRRRRLAIELGAGLAILALIPIGVSMQMPSWLLAAGWAWLVLYSAVLCVIHLRQWGRETRAGKINAEDR